MTTTGDIKYVRADDLLADPVAPPRTPVGGLGRRRHVTGAIVALLGLPLLTLLLDSMRDTFSLEGQVLLYLLAVVGIAVIGGMAVAVVTAVAAAFLINYYFVKPVHTLEVAQGEQALALGVFLVVAAVVSWAVETAARRARAAEQATLEAETLSGLARTDFEHGDMLHQVLDASPGNVRHGVGHTQRPGAPVRCLDRRGQRRLGPARRGGAAPLRRAYRHRAPPDRTRARAVRGGPADPEGFRRGCPDRIRGPSAQRTRRRGA